ncbi:unnamed protein product [Danaus chrysippus]|uniref:(African queen) hypothetical protein n=1 Tax=Danaus chrysippus TaxID=151541 RepID=A0A8J2WEM5_9NEOP|nr:unnamed protein product [Danaus chrysippus]
MFVLRLVGCVSSMDVSCSNVILTFSLPYFHKRGVVLVQRLSLGPAECPSRVVIRIPTKIRDPLHMLLILHQITPALGSFHHLQGNPREEGLYGPLYGTLTRTLRDGHAPY